MHLTSVKQHDGRTPSSAPPRSPTARVVGTVSRHQRVAVCFFGDGTTNIGFHGAPNFAVI
jgi:hypothetical protein